MDFFAALFLGLNIIADGGDATDKMIQVQRAGQEIRRVVFMVVVVHVQGKVIHILIAQIQNRRLPLGESRHVAAGAAAGDQF
ncbi:hypothetical protein D3C71_1845580 [compost metagenome]